MPKATEVAWQSSGQIEDGEEPRRRLNWMCPCRA